MKVASQVVRDWQLGWLLRYQNGALIQTPASTNQLENQLLRQGGFNGAPVNPDNRVPGVNPSLGQSELRMLQSADHAGSQSQRLDRSGIGAMGGVRSVLQQLPLAAAARRVDEFRPELPDWQGRAVQLCNSAPSSRTSSTGCSSQRPPPELLPPLPPLLPAFSPAAMAISIPSEAPGPNRGLDKWSLRLTF